MKKIIRREIQSPLDADILLHQEQLIHHIYSVRGVQSIDEVDYNLERLLPFQLFSGMEEATKLLAEAVLEQQEVLVIGDFDTDGATSVVLTVLALKAFGLAKVNYAVPNRFEFGYGLTPELLEAALQRSKPDLLITVDNGIASCAGVLAAKAQGIKVLITDHHLPGLELPAADAIVNPNCEGDEFPSKNLAGVGVIFYVMLALRSYLRDIGWFTSQQILEPNMAQFLDLVALGTVADVVQLDANNRLLVHQGLQRIRAGKCRVGIIALLDVVNRDYRQVIASDLGFVVAPRINAAGRLEDISLGIECLFAESVDKARELARKLEILNKERRVIEQDMQKQAHAALDSLRLERALPAGLCVFNENWHQGVSGILAARLKDKLRRPVIAFAVGSGNEIKGSARSIQGIHIRDVLNAISIQYPKLINRFGGHAMAAGLSLERQNYDAFNVAFMAEVDRHFANYTLSDAIYSDGGLSHSQISLDTARILRSAGPWGHGFSEPVFDGVFIVLQQRLVGHKHLKLVLKHPDHVREIDAIWFNIDLEVWPDERCEKVHIVYRLDQNTYNGATKLQLAVEYVEKV